MDKKEQIKKIKSVWNKCERILNTKGWNSYGNELLNLCKEESKQHNRFRGENIKRGLTLLDESKFFAVQRLTSYLYGISDYVPKLEDYAHTQKSVYLAYALSVEFKTYLFKEVSLADAEVLKSFDYVKLIEVE